MEDHALKQPSGYVGLIPVSNLWLLMLYASELFRIHGSGRSGLEDNPEHLPDLLGEILAHTVEQRQRRRLSLGFQSQQSVVSRVRGRVDNLTTERKGLLSRGRVACRFENLTVDTIRNRFVRDALDKLAKIAQRDDVAHRCRKLADTMRAMGVSGRSPALGEVSADRFGRHDSGDRFMVAAAKLAFRLAIPLEVVGNSALPRPSREEPWVRRLFERAVGGFYQVVLEPMGWRVLMGRMLQWQIDHQTTSVEQILPTMRTDIVLESRKECRRIIIDTKFNSILTSGWYRDQTIRSGYLYQMYAYLRSQDGTGDPLVDYADGILLHPCINTPIDETVVIQRHAIRFATVDLASSSSSIRDQLMNVIKPGEHIVTLGKDHVT